MRWFITKFLFSAIRSILSTVTTVVQTRCTQRRLLVLAICKGNGEASNRLANVAVNNYEGSVTNELYDSGVGKLKGVTLLMDHINLGWIFPKGDSICICIHYNKFGVGMNWSVMVLNVDNLFFSQMTQSRCSSVTVCSSCHISWSPLLRTMQLPHHQNIVARVDDGLWLMVISGTVQGDARVNKVHFVVN